MKNETTTISNKFEVLNTFTFVFQTVLGI